MRFKIVWVILALLVVGLCIYVLVPGEFTMPENFPVLEPGEIASVPSAAAPAGGVEVATFGSGCFWCTEAMFQQMKGVQKAVSGYSGGTVKNPTYQQVCSGSTGHAEVVQVTFDPSVVSYPQLLEVFWRTHDPTTRNRQGGDIGTQYRSAIFYHSEQQRKLAELYKEKIDAAGVFRSPLVTEIVPFTEFYPAEDYHQNFYANKPGHQYCQAMIGPKLEKLKKVFHDRLK
jgi:peptide-methionine (S)-S-oxide reductase